MSLHVKNLNGDTTFLLTFSPSVAPDHCRDRFPGAFTILVDPWLVGHSSVWNAKFQISHHTSKPSVSSLAAITQPDLILVSQGKPDHCHKETLSTLPLNSKTKILAVPAAAKQIKSWPRFNDTGNVSAMQPYDCKKPATVYRISLESYTTSTAPGQVTISYMPEKHDMTGLHNAIGITYRPPGTSFIGKAGFRVDLPMTPPMTPTRSNGGSYTRSRDADSSVLPPSSGSDSPMAGQISPGAACSSLPIEPTISVLYTPHGMAYSGLESYIKTHLSVLDALPLTALFHSFNVERNPWLMGGVVVRGFPAGLDLTQKVGARHWISAHDEVKDNKGWATVWIKSRPYSMDEAQKLVNEQVDKRTNLVILDSGQEMKA